MTATVELPPSPDLSQRDLEGHYAIQRMPRTPGTVHSLHDLGLDFDSPCISSGQQSYFPPSTPAPQGSYLDQPGYSASPYGTTNYRDIARYGDKYQSNGNTPPAAAADSAISTDLGLMHTPEYSVAGGSYTDSSNDYLHADQMIPRVDVPHIPDGNFEQTAKPPTPQKRTTRSSSGASKATNHKSTTTPKGGPNGEMMKVTRVLRPARKRKPGAEKSEKPKLPKLTKPLSELTDGYDNLPIKNMDSWVHRSAEVRRQEVEKRGGYITRPMNSFMLYRSAFAERTKMWCLQNNHQVVSSVSGESWPLEPKAIRDKYNELAKIERINHQSAHPGYKFSPSKAQSGKKKKDTKEHEESEDSELEGFLDDDGDYLGGGSRARKAARHGKKGGKGSNQNRVPMIGYMGLCYDHNEGGAQRSSFTHNNPGKTPPLCMGSTDMHLSGQYYQTTVRASPTSSIPSSLHPSVIEDMTIRKTQAPTGTMNMSHHTSGPYSVDSIGGFCILPPFDIPQDDSKVDPALLATEPDGCVYMSNGQNQEQSAQFIDEGIYDGQFDIDRLLAAASDIQIPDFSFPDGGAQQDPISRDERNGPNNGFDAQKLNEYEQSVQGLLESPGPWSGNGGAIIQEDSDQLRYDEWLH